MTDAQSPTVDREIRIAARPEVVFQYFVDPERMARWMDSSTAAITLDARPGGAIQFTVAGRHGGGGEFVEVDPPRRVVYTWGWDEPGHPIPPGSTRVEIDLTPDGDETILRLRHLELPADAVSDHAQGWGQLLDRLAILAAGGDPGPDPMATRAYEATTTEA